MKIPAEISRNIFVKGLNWVGDAIIATPTLRRLRAGYPESRITLMVRPWVAPVYEHNPDIDELWVVDDSRSFTKAVMKVRRGKFSLGIALPNSFRSAALMSLGGVKNRVGYARGLRSALLTRSVKVDPKILRQHQVYYYLALIEWMLDDRAEAPKLVLHAGEREREEVGKALQDRGLGRPGMRVGIAPGSINSDAKRWLPERFAETADWLASTLNAEVYLLGSAKEKKVLDKVAGLCKEPVANLAGVGGLGFLIALMERLHGFVGNDSGAMHVAAAMDVPSVAVFGPTEWETTYPFTTKGRIVRKPVDCAPCMLRACPLPKPRRHICMTSVETADVQAAFKEMAPVIRERLAMVR